MSQFARPNADAHVGNFENQAGGTTDIYQSIDEETASDADYVISPSEPSSEFVYVCGLSTVVDPETGTGHIDRYRYAKDKPPTYQIDLTVQLREGYVSEASPGTLIAAWTHTDISATAVTQAQTLSASEANAITDYSDLFLRFVFEGGLHFARVSDPGLIARHEYDDPLYPFSASDWTADDGTLSIVGDKLRLTLGDAGAFNRVLYDSMDAVGECMIQTQVSRLGNIDHLVLTLVSDVTLATFTGLNRWLSCGYSGRRRMEDYAAGTGDLLADDNWTNATANPSYLGLWADDSDWATWEASGDVYRSAENQTNNPHSGKAGFGVRYASADLERFFVVAGALVTITGLSSGQWIKIRDSGGGTLVSGQDSGTGVVVLDCRRVRLSTFHDMVWVDTDGITILDTVSAGQDQDSVWPGETWTV